MASALNHLDYTGSGVVWCGVDELLYGLGRSGRTPERASLLRVVIDPGNTHEEIRSSVTTQLEEVFEIFARRYRFRHGAGGEQKLKAESVRL